MRPVALAPNPIRRFYRGGSAIAALRGEPAAREDVPEDWVGSTTEAFGEPGVGPGRLAGGTPVADAVAADPVGWLGAAHVHRWGADPVLLVKLLDAGVRLPVHAHPDGPFAREHLGARFGKTEAWIVIGGEGELGLGWREGVSADALHGWIETQDAAAMLAALNPVVAKPGDAYFVPAGVPHAIGEGLLIVELQEPSDMSVLVEWRGHGIDGEEEATLGLGWEVALGAVERTPRDAAALAGPAPDGPLASLLPAEAAAFFRTERVRPDGASVTLDPGFAVVVAVAGNGEVGGVPVAHGHALLVPDAAGTVEVTGDVELIRCRPPAADAPAPAAR